MKKLLALVLLPFLLLTAFGCSDIYNEDPTLADSSVVESFNFPVSVQNVEFFEAPLTVISLSPAVSEIISDIGMSDRLVGRSTYCNYPDSMEIIQTVGSPASPDISRIVEINPSVLITLSPIAYAEKKELEKNGIKIVTFSPPKTYYELVDFYAGISTLFYGRVSSGKITEEKLITLDDAMYSAQNKGFTHSFVYIETNELAVATGDTLEADILSVFGNNIAAEKSGYSMSAEDIAAADPYLIFIAKGVDTENLPDSIKALDSYISGRIIEVDNTYFEKPSARLSELVTALTNSVSAIPPKAPPVSESVTD